VTGAAVCNGVDILDDLVLNFHVTLIALDLVIVNVGRMHEVCVLILIQSFPFSMAFETILARDFAVANNGVAVALVTRKSIIEDQGMVITRR